MHTHPQDTLNLHSKLPLTNLVHINIALFSFDIHIFPCLFKFNLTTNNFRILYSNIFWGKTTNSSVFLANEEIILKYKCLNKK